MLAAESLFSRVSFLDGDEGCCPDTTTVLQIDSRMKNSRRNDESFPSYTSELESVEIARAKLMSQGITFAVLLCGKKKNTVVNKHNIVGRFSIDLV